MKFPRFKSPLGQRGAVLVVALIMLVVSTLFVISMLKTSGLELKMSGANQVYANNFANAEAAINKFIADNSGRFAPGFLTLSAASGGVINDPPTGLVGGTVTVTATQITCGSVSGKNTLIIDVAATATGTLGGAVRMHQGLKTTAPNCNASGGAEDHDKDAGAAAKPAVSLIYWYLEPEQ